MDDRRRWVWPWRHRSEPKAPQEPWSGRERRRPPGPVDPGLRALLDDLARLDGRAQTARAGDVPPPRVGGVRPPGAGGAAAGGAPDAEVIVLPSARPSAGGGPGWAEVVDLAAYRRQGPRRRPSSGPTGAGEAGGAGGSADPAS